MSSILSENEDTPARCQWTSLPEALARFATHAGGTQGQHHIRPLHWYVACRLVLEGGFRPEEIVPRPPFRIETKRVGRALVYDEAYATGGERPILGGLKTKNVDVVVNKEGIGPVLAVSCKGMIGALRNLTNRMEETIGECTNIHITYPALVFGYLFVIRGNRRLANEASAVVEQGATSSLADNDLALDINGMPVRSVVKFHSALKEMAGRRGIRDDGSKYESVGLAMTSMAADSLGALLPSFPDADSPLRFERFFEQLYRQYDERFVFSAPELARITGRQQWSADVGLFSREDCTHRLAALDYEPRLADLKSE